jgi:hypothetical protein
MARIILSIGDTVLREITLAKERITIGRRPHNDIVIDDLAISGEHAVVVTRDNDSFLEDLNSTNGTKVNGQPVRKHFLQDNDVIELAQYRFCFRSDNASGARAKNHCDMTAVIKVLNGVNTGKEIMLANVITTLGIPGMQVAVITRQSDGYYLKHVEGDAVPLVNGQSIGSGGNEVTDGDVIDLCGTLMMFSMC